MNDSVDLRTSLRREMGTTDFPNEAASAGGLLESFNSRYGRSPRRVGVLERRGVPRASAVAGPCSRTRRMAPPRWSGAGESF